jgi:hypothetical protein
MQRTAIPKNLGHAARLWEWILLIAWVDQERKLLVERTMRRNILKRGQRDRIFLVERTVGRNFFSREDRGTEFCLEERREGRNFLVERTQGRNFFIREDRGRNFLVLSYRENRGTDSFSSMGQSRTDSFRRYGRRTDSLVVWVDQEQIILVDRANVGGLQILLVAGVDQERILLVEMTEGCNLLVL